MIHQSKFIAVQQIENIVLLKYAIVYDIRGADQARAILLISLTIFL